MNIMTIIGLLLGFGALIVGFLLEGGSLNALVLLAPAIIVFGGTFGATCVSYQFKQVKKIPLLLVQAFKESDTKTIKKMSEMLGEMAQTAKINGLLSLEKYVDEGKNNKNFDPILRKGVQMLIDGIDADRVQEELDTEVDIMEKDRHADISVFEGMAGFSPTMGVIGTVMGLVQTLSHMGAPEELTHSIASAFIATLYGVAFANLLYLPVANKLKLNLKLSVLGYEMMTKALIDIQNGRNVRDIREMMVPYLEAAGAASKKSRGEKSEK